MRIFICLAIILEGFLTGCSCNDSIIAYRYNLFQFQFPEHHMQAYIGNIPAKSFPEGQRSSFKFFGMTAILPDRWVYLSNSKLERPDQVVYKNRGELIIISRQKQNLLGCEVQQYNLSNKDFCSAFSSSEDFYWKLYTLTPESIKERNNPPTTGELWIVHKKGLFFETIKKISIYVGDGSTVFRSDYKPEFRLKTDLIIFNKKLGQDYLIISTTIGDEETIKALIDSQ